MTSPTFFTYSPQCSDNCVKFHVCMHSVFETVRALFTNLFAHALTDRTCLIDKMFATSVAAAAVVLSSSKIAR